MATYKKDVGHLLTQREVENMVARAKTNRDKCLILLLYLLGPRPIELVQLKKEDVVVNRKTISFTLPNSKIGNKKKFYFKTRTIVYPLKETAFIDLVINYWEALGPESFFFPSRKGGHISSDRVRRLFYQYSLNQFFPYNARHTRSVYWFRDGVDLPTVMTYRGTTDLKALEYYLRGKPPKVPEHVG